MSSGKMLTCANCGSERPEGTRFCGSCGTPFAQAEPQVPPAEPRPTTSLTTGRRRRWIAVGVVVAWLLVGGAVAAAFSLTDDDQPSQAEIAEKLAELGLDTTYATETDLFGDTTDTTGYVGQGVDETCDDLLAFARLAKDKDFARGGGSVEDIEEAAAAASAIASRAPAEPAETSYIYEGEPRNSLEGLAEALRLYVSLLSELGLEPGPDALLEPRVAEAANSVQSNDSTLFEWFGWRCSAENQAELQELGTSG